MDNKDNPKREIIMSCCGKPESECRCDESKPDQDPDRLEEFAPEAIEKIMEAVGVEPEESQGGNNDRPKERK